MTESPIVNEWIEKAVLNERRTRLLQAVEARFAGQDSPGVRAAIQSLPSLPMLEAWFGSTLRAGSYADFVAALRQ